MFLNNNNKLLLFKHILDCYELIYAGLSGRAV
jgi:hypothetical protein